MPRDVRPSRGIPAGDDRPMRRYWTSRDGLLVLPGLAVFAAIYLYPLTRLAAWSFFDPTFTLKHYRMLFAEPAYLAALQNIAKELYEAASVDGAGRIRSFLVGESVMRHHDVELATRALLFGEDAAAVMRARA